MATASGIDGQVMYAVETVVGTPVAVTRGIPHVNYTIAPKAEQLESASVYPGRHVPMPAIVGKKWAEATLEYELAPQGLGFWAVPILGAVTTTGTNPYTHTITPGETERQKGRTVELNVPAVTTSEKWTLAGAFVTKATLACSVGSIATVSLDLFAKDAVRSATAATSFSAPASWSPFSFQHLAVTTDGAATAFDEFSMDFETGLKTERFVFDGTGRPLAAKIVDMLRISGSLSGDYLDNTYVAKYLAGSTAELVATFDAGASAKLVISATIQIGETAPEVSIGDLTRQTVPFTVVRSSGETDAQAITMVLTNADTAP